MVFCCKFLSWSHFHSLFSVKVQGNKGKSKFSVLILYLYVFIGHFLIFFTLLYNLKIIALCHNFNFDKIYTLFGVNSFSPEIMVE